MQINIFKFSFLLLLLSVVGCKSTKSLVVAPPVIHTVVFDQVKADVSYLAADELEGRETGTKGETLAAEYISGRFSKIGIPGVFDGDEPYYQYFQKTIKSNPHADAPNPEDPVVRGKNVVGFLDKGSKYTIIIGAHYDHLGYGKEGSLYNGPPAIHNGADDNASGVAAMLALAACLKDQPMSNNVLFIAFSGEEKGLWGSNFFVDNSPLELADINFMINMDMVGRLNADRQLAIYGVGTAPLWNDLVNGISTPKFKYSITASGLGPSDHSSFYLEDIPVLHFFTGQHEDYHRPTDDTHKLNFDGLNDIVTYLATLTLSADTKGKFLFTKTKDESQTAPAFKVTLGVIPDYLFDGKGMRIDGVREGKTASVAGIKKGDIVVKMGDKKIVDMMSYMKALSAFEPGETTIVTIVREGDMMMRKEVTFQ